MWVGCLHARMRSPAGPEFRMRRWSDRWLTKRKSICSVGLIWIVLCATAHAAPSTSPSTPSTSVRVEYSEATDLFNLLDNLSDWLPGYTAPVYRSYMEAHGGLDPADRAALAAYADFRRRTSGLAKDADLDMLDRLFAPDATRDADPFSRHFLGEAGFEASAAAAIAERSADDQVLLRAYFARFVPRARRLIETAPRFERQTRVLKDALSAPAVSRLAAQMRDFFAVPESGVFEARFVWWPESDTTQAKVRGRTMLLYSQHDASIGASSMDWAPIVLHELSHYLSAGQPPERKRMLAANFLRLCPGAATLRNPLNALEEPLAIYWGQYRFEYIVRGRPLPPSSQWYIQADADRAAKAIATAYPADSAAPVLDDSALLAAAASACESTDAQITSN
ncbi:hypothetical protein M0D46_21205 [Xanthomonas prunicola]|uniref:hypothetical protein n=1 Tax=Xanthomonas prunicola TaxID=2053930 RepID=UPI0021B2D349|nr:hypothetical protein [Xanthomonas prunicola]UXA57738.1 hypothetical protein M0D47_02355 [Xanthomonas prunicola]UXA69481.1 hypothetical protein M0D46_21205 [Xanthomonas prunicola]